MPTLEQIQAKLKKLQAQAEALIAKRAQSVLDEIRKLMENHGLTTADIEAHSSTKKRRGRPAGSTSKAKAKGATKPKLPAKYHNPKTGETWSGWARPPLWIKDVKDRTKFLIDNHSATNAVVASTTKPASKKAAKKVGAKKASAKTPSAKAPAKKVSAKSARVASSPAKKAAAKKGPAKRALAKKAPAAKKSATGAGKTAPAASQDSASAVAATPAI
ncbi:DNA-binding protein H-NS [Caballeronia udeis]|uniref:DNA-binding protein H-NS n=1 Tax=Caballeronia udeis TaxID=1232866 RepID=A0ABW8MEW3_9BURK